MIFHRSAAVAVLFASAFALAACGEDETVSNEPAEQPVAEAPAAPAEPAPGGNMAGPPPAENPGGNMAGPAPADIPGGNMAGPAPDDSPGGNMAGPAPDVANPEALALADIAGRWAPSADLCESETFRVVANEITVPDGTCEVVSSDGSGNTLSVVVSCAGGGAGAGEETLIVTSTDVTRPTDAISVERGGSVESLVRCDG
jgi:hypothetical protein